MSWKLTTNPVPVGDGVTDDTCAIQCLIDNATEGSTIYLSEGVHIITEEILIDKPLTLKGDNTKPELKQITNNTKGIYITSSDVTVDSLTVTGIEPVTTGDGNGNSHAIFASGTETNYLVNINITNCNIRNWTFTGVGIDYVREFEISSNEIENIKYAGIQGCSVKKGNVFNNNINDIKCNESNGNGYGITVSQHNNKNYPRSDNVTIENNTIQNVSTWEGLDTHYGANITFNNNIVLDCLYGIVACGPWGPSENIIITNNFIDSGVIDGSKNSGIEYWASSGEISGNTIIGHGKQNHNPNDYPTLTTASGGVVVRYSGANNNITVKWNTIINPSPAGIIFFKRNNFTCFENTIIDPWTTSGSNIGHASAIYIFKEDNYINQGSIYNNYFIRKRKSADLVLTDGIYNYSSNNLISVCDNYSEAATYLYPNSNYFILQTPPFFYIYSWWPNSGSYGAENIKGRVVSGDYNGNGREDIAAFYKYGSSATRIHVWLSTGSSFSLSNGSQGWWRVDSGYSPSQITGRVVSGDYNGDGRDDIAAFYDYGGSATRIHVWLSSGSSFLYSGSSGWWRVDSGFTSTQVTDRVVSGDFNGDGLDDIAAFYGHGYPTTVFVFKSSGSSFYSTQKWQYFETGFDADQITGRVVAGNFNGSGPDDIAVFYGHGYPTTLFVFLSSGSSFYWPQKWQYFATGFDADQITGRVVSGDINGDGLSDIITMYHEGDGSTTIFEFRSKGSSFYWPVDRWHRDYGYDPTLVTGRIVSGNFNNTGGDDIAAFYKYESNLTHIQIWKK